MKTKFVDGGSKLAHLRLVLNCRSESADGGQKGETTGLAQFLHAYWNDRHRSRGVPAKLPKAETIRAALQRCHADGTIAGKYVVGLREAFRIAAEDATWFGGGAVDVFKERMSDLGWRTSEDKHLEAQQPDLV